ncbi:MAG: hypothetical protein ABJI22_07650 [Maribacter sp.]
MKSHLEELFRIRHRLGKVTSKIINSHRGSVAFEILWYKVKKHTFAKILSKKLFLIFLSTNVGEGKLNYDPKNNIYSFPDSQEKLFFSSKSTFKDFLRLISDFGKTQARLYELYQLEIEKREVFSNEIIKLKQNQNELLTNLSEFLYENKINSELVSELLPDAALAILNYKLKLITSKLD